MYFETKASLLRAKAKNSGKELFRALSPHQLSCQKRMRRPFPTLKEI